MPPRGDSSSCALTATGDQRRPRCLVGAGVPRVPWVQEEGVLVTSRAEGVSSHISEGFVAALGVGSRRALDRCGFRPGRLHKVLHKHRVFDEDQIGLKEPDARGICRAVFRTRTGDPLPTWRSPDRISVSNRQASSYWRTRYRLLGNMLGDESLKRQTWLNYDVSAHRAPRSHPGGRRFESG